MKTNYFDPYSAWKNVVDPIATGRAWRRKRLELNLSQDDLALIFELAEMGINMSKSAISAVENGKHKPSLDHAFFFAGLCACPVEELVVTCGRSREADDRDQLAPLISYATSWTNTCKRRCSSFLCSLLINTLLYDLVLCYAYHLTNEA